MMVIEVMQVRWVSWVMVVLCRKLGKNELGKNDNVGKLDNASQVSNDGIGGKLGNGGNGT